MKTACKPSLLSRQPPQLGPFSELFINYLFNWSIKMQLSNLKLISILTAGVVATLAVGAYSARVVEDVGPGIVAAYPADEGTPFNLRVALKADEGVPQNLVVALVAGEGVPQDLVVARRRTRAFRRIW